MEFEASGPASSHNDRSVRFETTRGSFTDLYLLLLQSMKPIHPLLSNPLDQDSGFGIRLEQLLMDPSLLHDSQSYLQV